MISPITFPPQIHEEDPCPAARLSLAMAFRQPKQTYSGKALACWLLQLVLCSSCLHRYYVPNVHNVPLFREKGQARISAGYSANDDASGVDVQTAVALSNHVGLMANGAWRSGEDGDNTGKGRLFELGLGYYRPIGGKGVFDIYGGGGGGSAEYNYAVSYGTSSDRGVSSVSFSRYFIQPSIGLTAKHFDLVLSIRLCRLSFRDFQASFIPQSSVLSADFESIHEGKSYALVEPAITARAGWESFKVQLQVGLSENLTSSGFSQEFVNIHLGGFLNIGKKAHR